MDREAAIDILNRALHDTVNSVVQYTAISSPYVPVGLEAAIEKFDAIKNDEARLAHELNELIGTLDGVAKVGVFPYWNVDLNYLDLRFMARFAADHMEKHLRGLERDLARVGDEPRVHRTLTGMLAQRRAHIEALREIAAYEAKPLQKAAPPPEAKKAAPKPKAEAPKKEEKAAAAPAASGDDRYGPPTLAPNYELARKRAAEK